MIPLKIDVATTLRTLTYYDRCAIRLTPEELRSVRLRISVAQLVSPLKRSQNFKYPYPKEFYGYAQAFSRNILIEEFPVNYTSQYIWDYWNEHLTLAHQLTSVFQRLAEFAKVQLDYIEFVLPPAGEGDQFGVQAARAKIQKLTEGLTLEEGGFPNDLLPNNDYVNSFNHPWDLIRFRFPFGTVFAVAIESWEAGATSGGSSSNTPAQDPTYDPTNPAGNAPAASDPSGDPNNPYGANPPASSPRDTTLDPSDFSNAPDPSNSTGTRNIQGWFIPGIPGLQAEGYAIGCPAGSLGESIPPLVGIQNPVNLGVKPITANANGLISGAEVLAAFPGFIFNDHFFSADTACGINGTY